MDYLEFGRQSNRTILMNEYLDSTATRIQSAKKRFGMVTKGQCFVCFGGSLCIGFVTGILDVVLPLLHMPLASFQLSVSQSTLHASLSCSWSIHLVELE